MIVRILTCLMLTIPIPALAQDAALVKDEVPKLETSKDQASYAMGYNLGLQIRNRGLSKVDLARFAEGMAAALKGHDIALTPEQIQTAFTAWAAARAAANLEAGTKFLEANKSNEGVKVTKSGLQYMVLKEGTGETPTTDSSVSTHYRGTLIDGTEFDSSYKGDAPIAEDEPAAFGVTQVITGWTEALQLMKVGAKYRLFIPTELAYGLDGKGSIEPNETLIFDLELISVR